MSNFNYMDNVPVKIAEKYKPPPRIYQLPQFVINKLNLPDGHYFKDPAYNYDFQFEKTVQTKIPEYRRMRQIEREARQTRREKREQERQRQVEENHKQMLAECSYPNAAELSSSESEDEENSIKAKSADKIGKVTLNKDTNWHHHNFDSILQPTVLTLGGDIGEVNKDNAFAVLEKKLTNETYQKQNDIKANNSTENSVNSNNKLANTFNYKDFEEDTSSPFDNIELKTINDLDILAQVLHNTQLKANKEINEANCELIEQTEGSKKNVESSAPIEALQTTIEHTKATLEKVNFSDINLDLMPRQQNDNIPKQHFTNKTFQPSEHNFINNAPQQNSYQIYQNQNFLYSPNCNRLQQATDNLDLRQMHYIGNNIENNYNILSINANDQLKQAASFHNAPKSQQISQIQQEELQTSKSKSVPDILRELRDEVRNSEIRRTRLRNHSFNQSDELEEKEIEVHNIDEKVENAVSSDECLKNLAVEVQYLAKNISSMGFPLERVANVAKIYGDDDKRIVEHLIPLTELLDLGFEETRISEALVKFDNNKEKALEHLIS